MTDETSPAGALTAEKDAIGKRFRKLPVEIEAVQWTPLVEHPGVLIDEGKRLTDFYSPAPGSAMRDLPAYFVTTIHEQRAYLVPGDWILPEPKPGRYYPVKPDIFAATYEPAENVQAPVAGIRSESPISSPAGALTAEKADVIEALTRYRDTVETLLTLPEDGMRDLVISRLVDAHIAAGKILDPTRMEKNRG